MAELSNVEAFEEALPDLPELPQTPFSATHNTNTNNARNNSNNNNNGHRSNHNLTDEEVTMPKQQQQQQGGLASTSAFPIQTFNPAPAKLRLDESGGEDELGMSEDDEFTMPKNSLLNIRKLVDASRRKRNPTPLRWSEFAADVRDNQDKLADLPFLRLTAMYDSASIGPVLSRGRKGLTPLQLLFDFYASRQDILSAGISADPTFDDIQQANDTMSVAEFIKFCHDMIPLRVQRCDIMWVFNVTAMERRSRNPEAEISKVTIDDFCRLLVRLSLVLWNDGSVKSMTPQKCVEQMCDLLHLGDFTAMRKAVERIGRVNGGFGAWSLPDEQALQSAKNQARLPRVRRGDNIDACMIRKELVSDLANFLSSYGTASTVLDWHAFPGPYIALVLPKTSSARKFRFRVTLQNVSSARGFVVCHRVVGIAFMSIKFLPPRPLAAGMEIMYDICGDGPLMEGEHVGAIVFSSKEGGPELFRCPIYVKVVMHKTQNIDHTVRTILRRKVLDGSLLRAFRSADPSLKGSLPRSVFRSALATADVSSEVIQHVVMRVTADASGNVDYMEFTRQYSQRAMSVASSNDGRSVTANASTMAGRTSAVLGVTRKNKLEGLDAGDAELVSKGRGVPLGVRIDTGGGSTYSRSATTKMVKQQQQHQQQEE